MQACACSIDAEAWVWLRIQIAIRPTSIGAVLWGISSDISEWMALRESGAKSEALNQAISELIEAGVILLQ